MNIPYIIEQTSRGERAYDIYSRLLKDRILFLGAEINVYTANLLIAQMLYLEADSPETDISFYINSVGGSISDGLAIYDTMQYIRCDIQTICVGRAYNIASILLASGTKGKRIALKNSAILLHQPFSGLGGQASDIQIQTKELVRVKNRLAKILSTHTQQTEKKILNNFDRELYLDSKDALQYGVVDKIMEKRKTNS